MQSSVNQATSSIYILMYFLNAVYSLTITCMVLYYVLTAVYSVHNDLNYKFNVKMQEEL